MIPAETIVRTMEEHGYRLSVADGRIAYKLPPEIAEPPDAARLLDQLRACKREVLALLAAREVPPSMPYLDGECLVIPFDAPARFRWWDGGVGSALSVCEILRELRAPAAIHRSYCSGCRPGQELAS